MKKLLWLDDIRDPFIQRNLIDFAPEFISDEFNIVWVKNYNNFTNWITQNGLPYKIAFDHDLGSDIAREKVKKGMSKRQSRIQKRGTKTGMDCAKWLVEYCLDNKIKLPRWVVQSANPVGKENINKLLFNYKKYCEY